MGIIRFAIRNPITVAVGVILASLFGLVSLRFVPVQLTPTVDTPQVTVFTSWPGASPLEIEREIIDEQEDQLKSLDWRVRKAKRFARAPEAVLTEVLGKIRALVGDS